MRSACLVDWFFLEILSSDGRPLQWKVSQPKNRGALRLYFLFLEILCRLSDLIISIKVIGRKYRQRISGSKFFIFRINPHAKPIYGFANEKNFTGELQNYPVRKNIRKSFWCFARRHSPSFWPLEN